MTVFRHVFTLENLSTHHYFYLQWWYISISPFWMISLHFFCLYFVCRYILGLGIGFLPGRLFSCIGTAGCKLESISRILCPRVSHRKIPFLVVWKKLRKVWKLKKSLRNHHIHRQVFLKENFIVGKFNLTSFQF